MLFIDIQAESIDFKTFIQQSKFKVYVIFKSLMLELLCTYSTICKQQWFIFSINNFQYIIYIDKEPKKT